MGVRSVQEEGRGLCGARGGLGVEARDGLGGWGEARGGLGGLDSLH